MAFVLKQRLINPNKLSKTIFFSLLLFNLVASDRFLGVILYRCVSSYNQTGSHDSYQTNLQPLFDNFTNAASPSSSPFYTTTAGKLPHKSYGMYLCRGDASTEICRSCVTNTTFLVASFNETANCSDFLAFADFCMVRFANYSFFGKTNYMDLGLQPGEEFSNQVSQLYQRTLEGALENVTTEAANNGTSFFATIVVPVDENENVYALAQCTPDISKGDCIGCFEAARASVRDTTGYLKGAWELMPSCQLKYDNSSFFEGSIATTSTPAAAASASKPGATAFIVIAFTMFIVGLF